ncbi:hypothetical protein [Rivibacter subsaxonicus]|uniref:Uncharacterized protein n=1 Tax=Rivibacter subsaxonicus TaxID=457575 RepID=A0A4Q7VZ71_9BURK|nr:hypothetical protein [Rivibacter subsaxonicus]RZU02162.1 hypothetical protein EV670_0181 [Rivibacter subsaxonicus]
MNPIPFDPFPFAPGPGPTDEPALTSTGVWIEEVAVVRTPTGARLRWQFSIAGPTFVYLIAIAYLWPDGKGVSVAACGRHFLMRRRFEFAFPPDVTVGPTDSARVLNNALLAGLRRAGLVDAEMQLGAAPAEFADWHATVSTVD